MSLRNEFLRLLKEDPEFRREVMGWLGVSPEDLRELKDLMKDMVNILNKVVEIQAKTVTETAEVKDRLSRLEKAVEELVEAQRKSEERLGEHNDRLSRLEKAVEELVEAQRKSEERLDRLEKAVEELTKTMKELVEAQKRNEERLIKLEEGQLRLEKSIGSISSRWGFNQEAMVRDFMGEILKQEGLDISQISSYTYVDENGTFGEKGGIYEVDILKRDGTTYLIEVKSYAQPKDVSRFNHTCYVVSKVLNLEKPVKMMVVNVATGRALERANYLGIRLIYGELT
ncbi:DUF3782 domain-containing protein [Metallosphaera javensis (ex Sakai et al. 2022)]|uniref:DUF3782 domain-containing protein n=1 Tax=Metallosphaera javensis (ex Sakai et al. 2022) TaxID=2775498 RepID=UPI002586F497|nr:MAG: chromosome partition protein Smc [Metallosphaera javensis (ex Sakai et al. 2022)]